MLVYHLTSNNCEEGHGRRTGTFTWYELDFQVVTTNLIMFCHFRGMVCDSLTMECLQPSLIGQNMKPGETKCSVRNIQARNWCFYPLQNLLQFVFRPCCCCGCSQGFVQCIFSQCGRYRWVTFSRRFRSSCSFRAEPYTNTDQIAK